MRAGQLRHRVTIQRDAAAKNAFGESKPEWVDVLNGIWANVADVTGRDKIGDVTNHEIDARMYLRWRSGIEAGMRVLHCGAAYLITSPPIDRTGRRTDMELLLRMDDGRQPTF